jgi:hypothetical protein
MQRGPTHTDLRSTDDCAANKCSAYAGTPYTQTGHTPAAYPHDRGRPGLEPFPSGLCFDGL